MFKKYVFCCFTAASWRKRLAARFPNLGSRVRVPSLHVGLVVVETESRFSRAFFRFPLPQISFHNFSKLPPFISFHLISNALVMVRQALLAGMFLFTDLQ